MKKNNMIIFFIFTFLMIGTTNSLGGKISTIGLLSLVLLLCISLIYLFFYYFKHKKIDNSDMKLLTWPIILVLYNLFNLLFHFNIRGVMNIAMLTVCVVFFIFIKNLNWTRERLILIGNLSIVFVGINFIYFIIQKFPTSFSGPYPNSNLMGIYMACFLYFLIIARQIHDNKLKYNISIVISLIMLFASDTRSAIIMLFIGLFIFIFDKMRSYKIHMLLIYLVLSLSVVFFYVYPKMYLLNSFVELSQKILDLTGKNLFSGRDVIWNLLLDIINVKPLTGYGPGALPSDYLGFGMSSHNYYLQTVLQSGFIGLVLLFLFFISIWKQFWKLRFLKLTRLSSAFFIGILVYQSFEISLTQNQLAVGLIQWLIIGIGCSKSQLDNEVYK